LSGAGKGSLLSPYFLPLFEGSSPFFLTPGVNPGKLRLSYGKMTLSYKAIAGEKAAAF
jgi:hypothetical protein